MVNARVRRGFGAMTMMMAMLAIILAAPLIGPERAFACSCMMPSSVKEQLETSEAVFAGHITSIVDVNKGKEIISTADPLRVTFEVSKAWKGNVSEEITIKTARAEASCGYEFSAEREYLVYAYGDEGNLYAGLCTLTKPLSGASDDMKELDKLRDAYEPGQGDRQSKVIDTGRPLASPGDLDKQANDGENGNREPSSRYSPWIAVIIVAGAIAGALIYYRRKE